MILYVLSVGTALAAPDVVLHQAVPAERAEAMARAALDRTTDPLAVQRLSDRAAATAPTLEPGQIEVCAAPTDLAAVTTALDQAEKHLAWNEPASARTQLDQAAGALRCLRDPVDPALAARVHLRRAEAALGAGDRKAAGSAFTDALRFDPELAWEARSDEDRELFQAAGMVPFLSPPARVSITPEPPGTLWLDGRTQALSEGVLVTSTGEHLLQLGEGPGLTLHLATGAAKLRIPSRMPADLLDDLASEPGRARAATYFPWIAAPGESLLLVGPDGVWEHVASTDQWHDRWTPVVEEAGRVRRRAGAGYALIGAGGAVAIGGAVVAGVTLGPTKDAKERAETAHDDAEYDAAFADWKRGNDTMTIGGVAAGVGLAVAGAGVFLAVHERWKLYPDLIGNAPGVSVSTGDR